MHVKYSITSKATTTKEKVKTVESADFHLVYKKVDPDDKISTQNIIYTCTTTAEVYNFISRNA